MKTSKLCALLLAGILVPTVTVRAADLFLANIGGTCKQIGDSDKIVSTKFNNATIIADYVAGQETPPDPKDLKIAYDPEGDRIVIANSAGEVLADVFSFGFATSVADSSDANRVRLVFLFPEGQSDAVGTGVLTEKITRDGDQVITKQTTHGTLSFARGATDTTPAQVCTGTFSVGKKLVVRTQEPGQ